MNRYLLPCPCSRRIAVASGQAGGTVRCPGCGAELVVPKLGDLARLEIVGAEPSGPKAAAWSVARACLLAGCLVMLAGAATAGWLRWQRATVAPLDEQAIRDAVASASALDVHASWLEFERDGIVRPPVMEEQRRLRHARALAVLERVAWLAAASGIALAVGGGLFAGRTGQARQARAG